MRTRLYLAFSVLVLLMLTAMLFADRGLPHASSATMEATVCPPDCEPLHARMRLIGGLHVVIKFKVPFNRELTDQRDIDAQRIAIRTAQSQMIQNLPKGRNVFAYVDLAYDATPYMVLFVDTATLDYLIASAMVLEIWEDTVDNPAFDLELSSIKTEVDRLETLTKATPSPADKCLVIECADLIDKAKNQGSLRVIVGLNTGWQIESNLSPDNVQMQRASVRLAQATLLKMLKPYNVKVLSTWLTISAIALDSDEGALHEMITSPLVASLRADGVMKLN